MTQCWFLCHAHIPSEIKFLNAKIKKADSQCKWTEEIQLNISNALCYQPKKCKIKSYTYLAML